MMYLLLVPVAACLAVIVAYVFALADSIVTEHDVPDPPAGPGSPTDDLPPHPWDDLAPWGDLDDLLLEAFAKVPS